MDLTQAIPGIRTLWVDQIEYPDRVSVRLQVVGHLIDLALAVGNDEAFPPHDCLEHPVAHIGAGLAGTGGAVDDDVVVHPAVGPQAEHLAVQGAEDHAAATADIGQVQYLLALRFGHKAGGPVGTFCGVGQIAVAV